ncbi:MAG: DegV family protein [Eubacteriales bacterium]|nr:DegV family protein [Eubacteriales bacterium]
MSFRIIADSCCDRTAKLNETENITFVPLTLSVGDYTIADDENFDQEDFIARTLASDTIAKSACPAPNAFAQAMECEEDDIYVITITDKLSGTYNSALQGKALFEEENGDKKNIHVFNSLATSGIESLVAEKIIELAEGGADFKTVVDTVEDFIVNHTALYFCLESLDVLHQNGRLYAMAASILQKIKLKLICERTQEGSVKLAGQEFSGNRALVKMANIIANDMKGIDASDKHIVLSHVCCEEKAKTVAQKLESVGFGKVEIIRASGLNSVYAANGGLIVSYTK